MRTQTTICARNYYRADRGKCQGGYPIWISTVLSTLLFIRNVPRGVLAWFWPKSREIQRQNAVKQHFVCIAKRVTEHRVNSNLSTEPPLLSQIHSFSEKDCYSSFCGRQHISGMHKKRHKTAFWRFKWGLGYDRITLTVIQGFC